MDGTGERKEHTRIKTNVPSRNDIRRRKGSLFDFREVVDRVAVQSDLSKRNQGEVLCGNRHCRIKDIDRIVLCFSGIDDLCIYSPSWEVALFDGRI